MAKRGRPPKGETMGRRRKTTLVIGDDLLYRLKLAALEDRTDVSSLLSRLAEDYLNGRKRGRR
jgi:hypothetical protein